MKKRAYRAPIRPLLALAINLVLFLSFANGFMLFQTSRIAEIRLMVEKPIVAPRRMLPVRALALYKQMGIGKAPYILMSSAARECGAKIFPNYHALLAEKKLTWVEMRSAITSYFRVICYLLVLLLSATEYHSDADYNSRRVGVVVVVVVVVVVNSFRRWTMRRT